MSRLRFDLVVFLAGCAAVCWIAAGYLGSNPLAFAVTLLIGACYLAGAFELRRYGEATATLDAAVAALAAPPSTLDAWLERLDPSLRGSVRLRVAGERAALPGPALTPYLVGLLVLLGMLGTLLGMVATLKGTGAALESAADPLAIRASLAAPVKGLGFAFGTSIAGVATSAMLGLLSALVRRRRAEAAGRLDARIATTLHVFSREHQREATLKRLERQADAIPMLADRLQAMMAAIEQQSLALNERQIALQQQFLGKAEAAYAGLADTVARSLSESVAAGARAASAAIEPVVETTMASLRTETAALQSTVTQAVERQLAGLAGGLETTAATVSTLVREALADQRRSSEALVSDQQRLHEALVSDQQRMSEALAADLRASLERYADTFAQRSTSLIDAVAARLDRTAETVSQHWNAALAEQTRASETLAANHAEALSTATAAFEQQAGALVRAVDASHATLRADLAAQDAARLAAWSESAAALSAALREHWDDAATQTAQRQQAVCETLERTASAITAQAQAEARATIDEIARLVEAASEAPRAAADVIAELREKLSESMARDTAVLEERTRLLETLQTVLDAVNHASTQQRGAIDALVSRSADLLERVGANFADRVESEASRLDAAARHITRGADEVARLGDALGTAVQTFGASNDKLAEHLQRIEGALDKSLARSDEQLAYYVAQAREVVDLSMLAQKQIMEELQRVAERNVGAGAEKA